MTHMPPLCDNPSGEYCVACRATGMSHCAYPDECGGMQPMVHHVDCRHPPITQPQDTVMSETVEETPVVEKLNGGEAIMGFVAFITGLETPLVASGHHTVYDAMELGMAFSEINGLREDVREDFHKRLKHPVDPRPQLAREQEERVQVAEERRDSIEDAAAKLVRKLDLIFNSDAYKSVFSIAQVHHGAYRGENCSEELGQLKGLLGLNDDVNAASTG